jgi:hypothetical protein
MGIVNGLLYNITCDPLLVDQSLYPSFASNLPYAKFEQNYGIIYHALAYDVNQWFIDNDIQYELKWDNLSEYRQELKIGFPNQESAMLFMLRWKGNMSSV